MSSRRITSLSVLFDWYDGCNDYALYTPSTCSTFNPPPQVVEMFDVPSCPTELEYKYYFLP